MFDNITIQLNNAKDKVTLNAPSVPTDRQTQLNSVLRHDAIGPISMRSKTQIFTLLWLWRASSGVMKRDIEREVKPCIEKCRCYYKYK